MNVIAIRAIMVQSIKDSLRAKWLVSFTIVFFFLAVNVPEIILLILGNLPPNYISAYLGLLVTLSYPYLPLLSLPIGAAAVVEERESGALQYVLSNPLSRFDFLVGRLLGLLLATTAAVVAGYGVAALVAFHSDIVGYAVMARLILIAIMLNATMLSISFFISIVARRKAAALGAAIFLWFVLTAITDIGETGISVAVATSPLYVVPLILLNPVQSSSVLALLQLNLPNEEIGIALAVKDTLGAAGSSIVALSLIVWFFVLLLACFLLFRKQDLP